MTELEIELTRQVATLTEQVSKLQEQLDHALSQIAMFTRQVFGQKSEQTKLPNEAQNELALEIEEDNAIENAPAAPAQKPKGGSKKGRKIRADLLPENLPVEETVLLPLAVQAAPEQYRKINEEVTDRLERIPGRTIIARLVRPIFVSLEEPFAAPITVPAPPALIPGGFLGPNLLADIILGKYLYHQPLYRQAKALEWESGVLLSQSTLCQNLAQIAGLLEPVVREISLTMWQSGYVQMDLTPVRCLSTEHEGGSFLGQMWVSAQVGGDVIYTWDKSKEALVAERIVPADFTGIIQTDGGSEIACFLKGGKERKQPPPDIERSGCWAHARRRFEAGAKRGCKKSKKIVTIINVLYRIESEAREAKLEPAERAAKRQKRVPRILAGLKRRLLKMLSSERPKSDLGKACRYTLNQWESLLVYLQHGHVEIDNNSVENAIRPCALGKKNYLFIGAVGAGSRAAAFYSILGSCLRRGLNPRAYLHWLFERLPTATNQTWGKLTPGAYAQAQTELAEAKPSVAPVAAA